MKNDFKKVSDKDINLNVTSGIKGLSVVSTEEGKHLGRVSRVFINNIEKKIVGFTTLDERWRKERYSVPVDSIELIGQDIVLIKSEMDCSSIGDVDRLENTSIENLQGHRIKTQDGKYLGQLIDAKFESKNWAITALLISGEKVLDINPNELAFGINEILVPSKYNLKIKDRDKYDVGILNSFFIQNIPHIDLQKEVQEEKSRFIH